MAATNPLSGGHPFLSPSFFQAAQKAFFNLSSSFVLNADKIAKENHPKGSEVFAKTLASLAMYEVRRFFPDSGGSFFRPILLIARPPNHLRC
jgi:hypothetical protein